MKETKNSIRPEIISDSKLSSSTHYGADKYFNDHIRNIYREIDEIKATIQEIRAI